MEGSKPAGSPYAKTDVRKFHLEKWEIYILIAVIVIPVVFYFVWYGEETHRSGIVIRGDRRFIGITKETLDYLENKSPYYYNYSAFYLDVVEQHWWGMSGVTEFNIARRMPASVYVAGPVTAENVFSVSERYSPITAKDYYASAFPHEACHVEEFQAGEFQTLNHSELERKCLVIQARAMVEFGNLEEEDVDYFIETTMDTKWWEYGRKPWTKYW